MYKEFKIGNYTQIENREYHPLYSDEIFEVTKVEKTYLGLESAIKDDDIFELGQKYKFIKPIIITEEWMVRLGWFKEKNVMWIFRNEIIFNWIIGENKLFVGGVEFTLNHVKHIHQIQNVCYSFNVELSL